MSRETFQIDIDKLAQEIVGNAPLHNYPAHSEAAKHMSDDYVRRIGYVAKKIREHALALPEAQPTKKENA